VWDVDGLDKCVEATGDPQLCSYLRQVNQLADGLVECVKRESAKVCFNACLKRCRGERCEEACLGALEVATGAAVARELAEGATLAAVLLGADPVDAVALAFDTQVKRAEEKDCPDKMVAARILSIAAIELYRGFRKVADEKAQDLLMLLAPAFALAHQCVGEEVFDYLEPIKPIIGEDATGRIVAALEQGAAVVGDVVIKFKPVKQ